MLICTAVRFWLTSWLFCKTQALDRTCRHSDTVTIDSQVPHNRNKKCLQGIPVGVTAMPKVFLFD